MLEISLIEWRKPILLKRTIETLFEASAELVGGIFKQPTDTLLKCIDIVHLKLQARPAISRQIM